MTKRGSFKNAVRRQARASGTAYTEALATMTQPDPDVAARVQAATQWRGEESLGAHLETRYGIKVSAVTKLSPHGAGVFRVDRGDGPAWVARLYPRDARPADKVEADAEILRFLELHDLPAERCAHLEPVSTHLGQSVLVTEFVDGRPGEVTVEHEHALADLLGRVHALPPASGALSRDGGAFPHDPLREGRPNEDLVAAKSFLDAIDGDVPVGRRARLDSLRARLESADDCEGLPEAFTHPDMVDRNVIVTPDGRRVAVDWKGAGRGPRLASFAFLLHGAGLVPGGDTEIVEAIVEGYSRHVTLEHEELARLAGAMRVRPLYFDCWSYWRSVLGGKIPEGEDSEDELTDAIAGKAVAALTR